jgi:hypothetical protein
MRKNGAKLDTFVRGAVRNDARDYLKLQRRKNGELRSAGFSDKDSMDSRGASVGSGIESAYYDATVPVWDAPLWMNTRALHDLSEEKEDELDAIRRVLTKDQYDVYMCRFILRMTQETTADYLRTTRNAIASRERKISANLSKAGLPVPKRVA